jgi:hypothetical protein
VWKDRNWRYRELLLESHPPPGDEWGEWADSGEPPGGASGEPHDGHNGYDGNNSYDGNNGYDGYNHGYYGHRGHHRYSHGYNHGYYDGYYDANHRHTYGHDGHDGCANRDHYHHRRYHIGAGYYYSAEHDGGADQPIPVHRLPDG